MDIRQTNFLGGELAPLLHGRNDLDIYRIGLRTMRNFFASRHGAAVSRPGTRFVAYAGGPTPNVRLLPFVYSDSQSFCLEFGANYIRFHTNGAPVLLLGVAYEVATPYEYYELGDLKVAQVGDVVTITHPRHTAMELKRLGTTNWTLTPVVFSAVVPYFFDVNGGPPCLLNAPLPVNLGPITVTIPDSFTAADATHPAKEWEWYVSKVMQHVPSGRVVETLAYRIVSAWSGVLGVAPRAILDATMVCYPDRPVTIIRGPNAAAPGAPSYWADYRQISENVYRGRGEVIGWVGNTKTGRFVDTGTEPDYSHQPPRGDSPFIVTNALGEVQPEEHPRAVAFFQERRCFAATELRPADIFTSATGDYPNFDKHIVPVSGEALQFELAARKYEQILDLVAVNKLLALTRSSCWAIAGQQTMPLDFDSIDARVIEEVGSIGLTPLLVDGNVLYARAKGQGVRALVVANTQSGYQGVDVSMPSQHLFVGTTPNLPAFIAAQLVDQPIIRSKTLIDWTYAEDPWGIVWAVREDGAFLSFTPRGSDGQGAWARHDTNGWVRSVCAVPEGDEDAVYMAVTRPNVGGSGPGGAVTCIERMSSRLRREDENDDNCVDCAIRFEGAPALNIVDSELATLEGCEVWVIGVGNAPQGPLGVAKVNVGTLMAPVFHYQVTLPSLPVPNKGGAPGDNGPHTGGTVVLYIGLPYTPELETLDATTAELKLRQKTVTRIGFEVDQSFGLLCGQDFDHLKETRPHTVASGYSAPGAQTGLLRAWVKGTWDDAARAVLRQSKPLPVTVVGLVRDIDVGG